MSAIPDLMTKDAPLQRFAQAVKQRLDRVSGQQRNLAKLDPLPVGATNEQMRVRLNELLERMQG